MSKKKTEGSFISNSAWLRIPQKGNLISRPSQTGQIDSKLVSHDALLKKALCIQQIIDVLSRGMDRVPVLSVVKDRAQVSGGRVTSRVSLQSRTGTARMLSSAACQTNKSCKKHSLCKSFMLKINKYIKRFIDVSLVLICRVTQRLGGKNVFVPAGSAQFIMGGNEVGNSHLWSVSLSCPVAARGLRRHLCKCSVFVCT